MSSTAVCQMLWFVLIYKKSLNTCTIEALIDHWLKNTYTVDWLGRGSVSYLKNISLILNTHKRWLSRVCEMCKLLILDVIFWVYFNKHYWTYLPLIDQSSKNVCTANCLMLEVGFCITNKTSLSTCNCWFTGDRKICIAEADHRRLVPY